MSQAGRGGWGQEGALTLLHELHSQAGAVGAHERQHAHHHDEHPGAQHGRGHHQQLLDVGEQVPRRHLLQQVLWGARGRRSEGKGHCQSTVGTGEEMHSPPRAGNCPPAWRNTGRCFQQTSCPGNRHGTETDMKPQHRNINLRPQNFIFRRPSPSHLRAHRQGRARTHGG